MGVAIYDMAGLTHQGTLDRFWTAPQPPDAALADAYVRALAHGVHARGAVYGPRGRRAFVANAIARLEGASLHRFGLFAAVPPRLARARAMGIAMDWPE
jgi:capsular polysaccharide export protein